jgi:hypothetical protein
MDLNTNLIKTHRLLVRAFRSVDDPAACLEFLRGHTSVLEKFKISHITSNTTEWTKSPTTITFTIESLEDGSMLGGGRLQVYDYKFPLPIEKAVGDLDKRIYGLVNEWAQEGVAEFCGLWNTREALKMGVSSVFLARIGVALASQLKIKHMVALTAPATVKTSKRVGFVIEESLGNKGTFYYPKISLIATLFHMKSIERLDDADPLDREIIFEMRKNMCFHKKEEGINTILNVEYHLKIENLDKSRFYHIQEIKV